ncbi:Arginine/serine-rich coiled-coil protein 2 [Chionoecetes opilio]|uniref:Arginine/serine-rich coiled-coil protein 2 n=1 Tax=Chionoecetes opilio TaxID=41210 RepID=A0A8J5CGT2_CHIOP|nr:Arginine/serine-rich coiled-coil protein 2 [Chionoecetes opilio]
MPSASLPWTNTAVTFPQPWIWKKSRVLDVTLTRLRLGHTTITAHLHRLHNTKKDEEISAIMILLPAAAARQAQQKLAALKAANPDLTAAELLKRSMEAQVVEVQKQTGIILPSYYNPAAMNPMKFAEQERKKKLLWGNKSAAGIGGQETEQSGQ